MNQGELIHDVDLTQEQLIELHDIALCRVGRQLSAEQLEMVQQVLTTQRYLVGLHVGDKIGNRDLAKALRQIQGASTLEEQHAVMEQSAVIGGELAKPLHDAKGSWYSRDDLAAAATLALSVERKGSAGAYPKDWRGRMVTALLSAWVMIGGSLSDRVFDNRDNPKALAHTASPLCRWMALLIGIIEQQPIDPHAIRELVAEHAGSVKAQSVKAFDPEAVHELHKFMSFKPIKSFK